MAEKQHGKPFAILTNRCPSCHHGKIYKSYLIPRDDCESCGFKLSEIISGDGPAVFVVFFAGVIGVLMMFFLHYALGFGLIASLISWVISVTLVSILSMQVLKTAMIFLEYSKQGS